MIPVLARSKARVYGLSLAGNPASGIDVFLVNVVRCQVEVSALGRSLVQSSPAECVVFVCNLETSSMGRPRTE